jgi:hypothetical protein
MPIQELPSHIFDYTRRRLPLCCSLLYATTLHRLRTYLVPLKVDTSAKVLSLENNHLRQTEPEMPIQELPSHIFDYTRRRLPLCCSLYATTLHRLRTYLIPLKVDTSEKVPSLQIFRK